MATRAGLPIAALLLGIFALLGDPLAEALGMDLNPLLQVVWLFIWVVFGPIGDVLWH